MTISSSLLRRAEVAPMLLALLCCLLIGGGGGGGGGGQFVSSQQLQQVAPVQAGVQQVTGKDTRPAGAVGVANGAGITPLEPARVSVAAQQAAPVSEDQRKFNDWQKHPLYVPPFDAKVLVLPELQVAFIRNMTANDLVLFREIAEEAIRIRNKWTPSVKLMFKYTGRLLGTFIRNRRAEQKIPVRVEPHPEFFTLLADLVQSVLDRSAVIKREKGYDKSTLDVDTFRARLFATFDYFQRIINTSPLGGYLQWSQVKMFADEPKNPLYKGDFVEEISDMAAQFRGMGYESTIFVGRRIVNMLRLFGRGILPSDEKEI